MDNLESLKEKQEELENELKELDIQIKELEKQEIKKSDKRWRARNSEAYYYLYSYGKIIRARDYRSEETTNRYNLGNYFRTKEEAEKTIEKIKIYAQLKDLALRLNKGEEIDWGDYTQYKYSIYYDCEDNKLKQSYALSPKDIGQIYCLDEKILEKAKEEIGEENLKKLFE